MSLGDEVVCFTLVSPRSWVLSADRPAADPTTPLLERRCLSKYVWRVPTSSEVPDEGAGTSIAGASDAGRIDPKPSGQGKQFVPPRSEYHRNHGTHPDLPPSLRWFRAKHPIDVKLRRIPDTNVAKRRGWKQ